MATLFHLGWPHVDADRRASMAAALDGMLDWCLGDTVRPDGSVRVDVNDDSDETAAYFAVGLLGELGVFDPAKRFWSGPAIPGGRRSERRWPLEYEMLSLTGKAPTAAHITVMRWSAFAGDGIP